MTEPNDVSKLEISEVWKFAAAIGVSCALSFCGNWVTQSSNYTTEADVLRIVESEQRSVQLELKHNNESLKELKTVVENNNKVLGDIRIELGAMREERKFRQINNVKSTD